MTVLDKAKQAALYSDEGLADLDPALAREDAGSLLDMVIQVSGCDSKPEGPRKRGASIRGDDARCAASPLGGECL